MLTSYPGRPVALSVRALRGRSVSVVSNTARCLKDEHATSFSTQRTAAVCACQLASHGETLPRERLTWGSERAQCTSCRYLGCLLQFKGDQRDLKAPRPAQEPK